MLAGETRVSHQWPQPQAKRRRMAAGPMDSSPWGMSSIARTNGPMDPPAGMVSSGQIVKIYVNMVPTEVSRNFWFQGRDSLQTWSENPPAATSCVFNWEAKPPAAHWFPHPPKNPGSLGDGRHRPRGALGANATLSGHDVTNMDQLWINNSLHRTLHAWHWASVWAVTWVCLEYSTAKSHD